MDSAPKPIRVQKHFAQRQTQSPERTTEDSPGKNAGAFATRGMRTKNFPTFRRLFSVELPARLSFIHQRDPKPRNRLAFCRRSMSRLQTPMDRYCWVAQGQRLFLSMVRKEVYE